MQLAFVLYKCFPFWRPRNAILHAHCAEYLVWPSNSRCTRLEGDVPPGFESTEWLPRSRRSSIAAQRKAHCVDEADLAALMDRLIRVSARCQGWAVLRAGLIVSKDRRQGLQPAVSQIGDIIAISPPITGARRVREDSSRAIASSGNAFFSNPTPRCRATCCHRHFPGPSRTARRCAHSAPTFAKGFSLAGDDRLTSCRRLRFTGTEA